MDDVTQWVFGQPLGLAALIVATIAFVKEWVVPGVTHRRQQEVINAQRDTIAIQAEALLKATEGLELSNGLIKGLEQAVREQKDKP